MKSFKQPDIKFRTIKFPNPTDNPLEKYCIIPCLGFDDYYEIRFKKQCVSVASSYDTVQTLYYWSNPKYRKFGTKRWKEFK